MDKLKNYAYSIILVIIIAFGICLRLNVLLFGHGFQTDEANLALNIIDRNYLQLFLPLDNIQVAPPLFLILCKFIYSSVKYNYTPYISDLLFRIIPFISGVLAIPVFGYLLNILFKNKLINIIGMFLLTIAPTAISYSCIFKQYSTEMLVLMLMLITFLKIDFKNKSVLQNTAYFLLLGIAPFFSMTACFTYPGGFLYIFITSFSKKDLSKAFICFASFSIVFIIYVFIFLLPVSNIHYVKMREWWMITSDYNVVHFIQTIIQSVFRNTSLVIYTFAKNYYVLPIWIIFIIGFLLFIKGNYKKFLLNISPIFITFLFVLMHSYPIEERFFIFLLPCILIICLYPLYVLIRKFEKSTIILTLIFTFWVINYLMFLTPNYVYRIHKLALPSNQIWSYWHINFKNDGTLLFGDSVTSSVYYLRLYEKSPIPYKLINQKDLPSGIYYLIITSFYSIGRKEVEALLKQNNIKILDARIFAVPTSTDYIRQSYYMKFIKQ